MPSDARTDRPQQRHRFMFSLCGNELYKIPHRANLGFYKQDTLRRDKLRREYVPTFLCGMNGRDHGFAEFAHRHPRDARTGRVDTQHIKNASDHPYMTHGSIILLRPVVSQILVRSAS